MRLILLLLIFLSRGVMAEEWPGVPFQEVRAFAWRIDRTDEMVILPGMAVAKGSLNPKGVLLTPGQVRRLRVAQARRQGNRPVAGCYVPHNAFVFYDGRKKPVAFLEICFDCLGSRLFPQDDACDPDFISLAEICAELKLPFGRFKSWEEFRRQTEPILGLARKTEEPPADTKTGAKPPAELP